MSSLISKTVNLLEAKSFPGLLSVFGRVAAAILFAMMMVVVVDAIGRKLGHPVFGTYEAVSFLLGLLFCTAIAYCGARKGHLIIDAVTKRMPKARLPIVAVFYLVSTLLSWVLTWQLVVHGFQQKELGATGVEFTFLHTYPFIWALAVGFVVLGWVFLVQTLQFLGKIIEGNS
jgi:TRAP-type mannitol/chloroaromatic compound transport system permease small subunit